MLSKTEKFRRGSQGNHSAALSIYKGIGEFYFAALNFCFFCFKTKESEKVKKVCIGNVLEQVDRIFGMANTIAKIYTLAHINEELPKTFF